VRVVWLGCREAPMTVGILVRERQNRRRTRMSGVAQPAVQELELRLNAYKGGSSSPRLAWPDESLVRPHLVEFFARTGSE